MDRSDRGGIAVTLYVRLAMGTIDRIDPHRQIGVVRWTVSGGFLEP